MKRIMIRTASLTSGIVFMAFTMMLWPGSVHGLNGDSAKPPLSVDPDFKPRLGTYHYQVDFNNVNIGSAKIVIGRDNDLYKVQVLAQSIGMIDKLYHLRYRGEALLDTDPLSPVETKMQQEVKSTEKDTTIKFQDNGTIKAVEKKSENGSTVKYDVRRVQTDRFTLDPFSATYLVRGLDWNVGVEKVFDVYPGKHQYELRLKCENLVTIDMGGEKRRAWEIVPTVKNLDPEKQAEALKKRKTTTKIYVSADDLKDVLKIEASHTLGNFRVVMVRFDPAAVYAKETNSQPHEGDSKTKTDVPARQVGTPAGE
jgi:hypothetical protein